MSFLGGIMRSAVNPLSLAQLAAGPAGWATLAMRTLASAVGQQVLQQLGQQLGLPQSVISLAQNSYGAATGTLGGPLNIQDAVSGLADQFGLSALEQGQLTRSANDAFRSLSNSLAESDEFKAARTGKGGESIFMKIARVLGELADKKLGEMVGLADQIGATTDGKQQNEITSLTGKMQGKSQEFGLISNAMTNVIKTIGEGVSTISRKG
ncbi:hypothetical protein ACMGDM_19065 [Sphingomonas sp. DT-51]|uniref:hypothetical protein n=1 Tax=Sphingomonas sp. DT-51 TaxID=3396165 RepID=UPI003F1D73EE